MVNLHPCVGTIVWKHRSLSALHFAECGPSCLGTQSRKWPLCGLGSGCCVSGQFSVELVGWLWLLRQVVFSCARKRWKTAAQSSVGKRHREEKFLVKKDELPYDSCCAQLRTSLHPQPHKLYLYAEGPWTNEPGKRRDLVASCFFRPVLWLTW